MTIAWAIYWINYLPEVKEKLIAEIATLGTERDPIAISKLPYLNAVNMISLFAHVFLVMFIPILKNVNFQSYSARVPE